MSGYAGSIISVLLMSMLACGRAATYMDGSVNATRLDAKDSAAVRFVLASGTPGQSQRGFAIRIDSRPALCSRLQQGSASKAGDVSLDLVVLGLAGAAELEPGPYNVILAAESFGVRGSSAAFVAFDASCSNQTHGYEAAGTIFLSSISPAMVKGDFDLNFINGSSVDHVTGAFEAPICTDLNPSDTVCEP